MNALEVEKGRSKGWHDAKHGLQSKPASRGNSGDFMSGYLEGYRDYMFKKENGLLAGKKTRRGVARPKDR